MPRSYRTIVAAAALLLTMAVASASYAEPAKTKSHAVVGTLQKVDGLTLTVQTPKGEETVLLVASSRIHQGAATVLPANLSSYAGRRVKIRYVENNGTKQAQTVALASSTNAAADSATNTLAKKSKN